MCQRRVKHTHTHPCLCRDAGERGCQMASASQIANTRPDPNVKLAGELRGVTHMHQTKITRVHHTPHQLSCEKINTRVLCHVTHPLGQCCSCGSCRHVLLVQKLVWPHGHLNEMSIFVAQDPSTQPPPQMLFVSTCRC